MSLFVLTEVVDLECPHCPVHNTDEYVDFHHRRGSGTWVQLREYAERIKRYLISTRECGDRTRKILATMASIPCHRQDIDKYKQRGV